MREGRVTMTTEKVSDGFYQLSGRRINWDLTDYHPLLAQRKDSLYVTSEDLTTPSPSIGYSSATDIREAANGDFLMILSDTQNTGAPAEPGAAGALAIFSRSVGPFEQGRATEGYLRAMRIVGDPAATGRAGSARRLPPPRLAPDGRIMAAYTNDGGATLRDRGGRSAPPATTPHTTLITGGDAARGSTPCSPTSTRRASVYQNRRQLVFGGDAAAGDAEHAVLHIPDAPMTFTLLTGNLRRGRPVEQFRDARTSPSRRGAARPSGTCMTGGNGIYENRSDARPRRAGGRRLGAHAAAVEDRRRARAPGTSPAARSSRWVRSTSSGPASATSMGVRQELFDAVCGGCHGSISGRELDVAVTPDALTSASKSESASASSLTTIGPWRAGP